MIKVLHIVGARPNFIKIAPIMAEMARCPEGFSQRLVHTGQHYDQRMSRVFFEELGIPPPDLDLGVGSGSHAQQTARIMERFEPVALSERPDLVLVVGDVNSTLACALVAAKLGIRVAHVEAGLRSFDRRMPEEINRMLTDQLADLLLTSEADAKDNLLREGIPEERIHFVGNVMIDTLLRHKERALALPLLEQVGLERGMYAALTLHRSSNVDDPQALSGILDALDEVQRRIEIVFPIHPRTAARVREFGFEGRLEAMPNLHLLEPLGYLEFLNLMANARLVLNDSGGIQEETTILQVPCITMRENTERPVTLTEGTNILVGNEPSFITWEVQRVLVGSRTTTSVPELWDGEAAERIVRVIQRAM